ncbi:MAG TPA: Kazal-type serine protease inhibitor domain-containing protein [Polyangiales bacterium]|nr:Kazal-type serine protease inhibitor domain-containing protein [Polyangiales bacterium]
MMKLQQEPRLFALCSFALFALLAAAACDDDKNPGKHTGGVETDKDAGKDSGAEAGDSGSTQPEVAGNGGVSGEGEAGASGASGAAGSGGTGESGAGGKAGGAAGKAGGGAGKAGAGEGGAGEGGAGGRLAGGGEGGRAGSSGAGAGGSEEGSGGAAGGGGEGGVGGGGGSGGQGGAGSGGSGGEGGAAGGGGAGGASGGGGSGGGGGEGGAAGGGGTGGSAGMSGQGRCGTRGGVECRGDEFCNFAPDAECGANDRGGVCQERSNFCPAIYAPVCGCDNRTYGNECAAHGAGASVKHDSLCTVDECEQAGGHPLYGTGANVPECLPNEQSWAVSGGVDNVVCCMARPPGPSCGANQRCDDAEFCNYETSAGGQGCDGKVADAHGVCQQTPDFCTREFNPVCGCDHRLYSNTCDAHFYGIAILHEGACTELDCAAVAGRVVYPTGPAPMCRPDEEQYTYVVQSTDTFPATGAICCVQAR